MQTRCATRGATDHPDTKPRVLISVPDPPPKLKNDYVLAYFMGVASASFGALLYYHPAKHPGWPHNINNTIT